MYICRVFLFMLMIIPINLLAQNNVEEFDKKAQSISEIGDINEKKYELAEFAKSFKDYLQENSSSFDTDGLEYIKTTKSSDSKYAVFYFNTFVDGVIYRIDWFILYGDVNTRKVIHSYHDKIKYQPKKDENGELQLSLARLVQEDVVLYPLTFSFKSGMKTLMEYRDVATICMFEELMLLNTSRERKELNNSIVKRMKVLWNNPEWFLDEFNGLKRVSTLVSEDETVKVCTWNVPLPNSVNLFFGAVIVKTKYGYKVSSLIDNTSKVRSPQRSALSAKKWFGAIYYDIIPVRGKNKKTYYILLGYKPNNEMTKMKVVEPMMVVGNGSVRFGHSIFQADRYLFKRLVFEYTAATNMLLKYEEEEERIVLDHLAPPNPIYKGNKRFYGPDFSYDAYVLEKGRWVLYRDIDVRNPEIKE